MNNIETRFWFGEWQPVYLTPTSSCFIQILWLLLQDPELTLKTYENCVKTTVGSNHVTEL